MLKMLMVQLWFQVQVFFVLAFANSITSNGEVSGQCNNNNKASTPRPHSVSILEFGAVGDGVFLNTLAFENSIFYLRSFVDKGGTQLYVPKGKWLTGSFNLTSHLTLFLEKDAVILGSQVISYKHRIFVRHSIHFSKKWMQESFRYL